jgi:TonB family protein
MVVGVFRPVVLLPERYTDSLDEAELASVFAHELEHVRRRDNLSAALHELVTAFFWFDPLHWIARRRLLELRERACDERVLEGGCEPRPYVAALAKTCHAAIESPAIACMSGFHVRERIESIMSYSSDRAQFLPDKFVRVAALAAALAIVASFAAIAPAPALAAKPETDFGLSVSLRPGPDGRFLVDVNVTAPDGERVLSSKVVTTAGQPVTLSTSRGGRTYQVEVSPSADGSGVAVLQVTEGRDVLYRSSEPIRMQSEPSTMPSNREPITLQLKDADLHDVVRTFGQLTGRKVTADPSLQGKVSIDVANTPWDIALLRAIAPLGLTLSVSENEIRVIPTQKREPRPAPPGYKRLDGSIKPPEPLSRVEPVYTEEARQARVSGIVIVEAQIDETGVVRNVSVVKSLPFGLGDSAAEAVRRWVFAPALLDGKPVPVIFNITINFKIDQTPKE